jgi:hypothetical protein
VVSTSSPSTNAPVSPEDNSGAAGTGTVVVVVVVVVAGGTMVVTNAGGATVDAVELPREVCGAATTLVFVSALFDSVVDDEGSTEVTTGAMVVVVAIVVVVGATLTTTRLKTAVSELEAPLFASTRRAVMV